MKFDLSILAPAIYLSYPIVSSIVFDSPCKLSYFPCLTVANLHLELSLSLFSISISILFF